MIIRPAGFVGVVLLVCAGCAMPQGQLEPKAYTGWFGGFSGGMSNFRDYELDSEADDVDENDFGYSMFAGYQFALNFAVATGYVDLGSLEADGPTFGGFEDELEASGIPLTGIWIVPIAERTVTFVSAGVFFWEQDVTYMDGGGPFNEDASGSSPMFGIGFNRYFDERQMFGLHVEWTRFFDVGDLDVTGHENDINFFSIGLIVHTPVIGG